MSEYEELKRRMLTLEGNVQSWKHDNRMDHKDMKGGISELKLAFAEARGMKTGIILAFSFMWALLLAGVAAAWKWLHT